MISEFKVTMSNFSAENQKGPGGDQLRSPSRGGKDFHGSGVPLRPELRAERQRLRCSTANGQPRPENKYYYPGFTLGGPVLIPGTKFNKNRNKLFFFTGFEYFYQVSTPACCAPPFPPPAMLNGNFSPAELAKLGNITASGGPPGQINGALALYPGGIIPANADRQEHAGADEAVSAAECRPQCHRRLQLCAGD